MVVVITRMLVKFVDKRPFYICKVLRAVTGLSDEVKTSPGSRAW